MKLQVWQWLVFGLAWVSGFLIGYDRGVRTRRQRVERGV